MPNSLRIAAFQRKWTLSENKQMNWLENFETQRIAKWSTVRALFISRFKSLPVLDYHDVANIS